MHIFKLKKPIWKGSTLYDSNYMIFLTKQNYGDINTKKTNSCEKFKGKRGVMVGDWEWSCLNDNVMVGT